MLFNELDKLSYSSSRDLQPNSVKSDRLLGYPNSGLTYISRDKKIPLSIFLIPATPGADCQNKNIRVAEHHDSTT